MHDDAFTMLERGLKSPQRLPPEGFKAGIRRALVLDEQVMPAEAMRLRALG